MTDSKEGLKKITLLLCKVFFAIVGHVLLKMAYIVVKEQLDTVEIGDYGEKNKALVILRVVLTDVAALSNKKGSAAIVLIA